MRYETQQRDRQNEHKVANRENVQKVQKLVHKNIKYLVKRKS